MHDLKDVTCDVHYENYRAQCIQQMTRYVIYLWWWWIITCSHMKGAGGGGLLHVLCSGSSGGCHMCCMLGVGGLLHVLRGGTGEESVLHVVLVKGGRG